LRSTSVDNLSIIFTSVVGLSFSGTDWRPGFGGQDGSVQENLATLPFHYLETGIWMTSSNYPGILGHSPMLLVAGWDFDDEFKIYRYAWTPMLLLGSWDLTVKSEYTQEHGVTLPCF
jgi:hypothetical protein